MTLLFFCTLTLVNFFNTCALLIEFGGIIAACAHQCVGLNVAWAIARQLYDLDTLVFPSWCILPVRHHFFIGGMAWRIIDIFLIISRSIAPRSLCHFLQIL
jgi:hypothetical protein